VALTVMQAWHVALPAPEAEGALRRIAADGPGVAPSGGSPATTATKVDGGFLLTGRKGRVLNIQHPEARERIW
jgi:acyl-CoA dehydrogenase